MTRWPERLLTFAAMFAWVNTALSIGANGFAYVTVSTFTVGAFAMTGAHYARKARAALAEVGTLQQQNGALRLDRTRLEDAAEQLEATTGLYTAPDRIRARGYRQAVAYLEGGRL